MSSFELVKARNHTGAVPEANSVLDRLSNSHLEQDSGADQAGFGWGVCIWTGEV